MTTSYQETLDYLFGRLPVFQHIGKAAYKADLNNTIALAHSIGNPENSFKSIHVAGTNGKGSVSSLLAAIYSTHGFKTGLYTSPHLKDFRERIRIDGEMIGEDDVIEFTESVKPLIEQIQPSFFEITVAMAFHHFRKHKVDIAIVETGMGGRLDSTNIITPILSVITNIGMDHMEFLGDTPAKIAFEKAGIIKRNVPVVIGESTGETQAVFIKKAAEMNAPISFASDYPDKWNDLFALKGNYQRKNLATVNACLSILALENHLKVDPEKVDQALQEIKERSGLRGRWEILGQQPLIIADAAHNEHGLKPVMQQLNEVNTGKIHFVLGVVNDKDLEKIFPLLPPKAEYYYCKPNVIRGLDPQILFEKASLAGFNGKNCFTVAAAIQNAKEQAQPNDVIYIGGSTFVVAEALPD